MAKENYVFITGQLQKEPVFVKNREGRINEVVFPLRTIRRGPYDRAGNFDPKFDSPILKTKDPRLISIASTFHMHDLIESKCVIVTEYADRTYTCPHCGCRFVRNVFTTFLSPVSLSVRNREDTTTNAMHILQDDDVAENSNVVKIIGRVTNEDGPRYNLNEATQKKSCTYQIAVNRKFLLYGASKLFGVKSEGNEGVNQLINEERSDYPWVVCYDSIADEARDYLHQGSLIYIDGYFHTRPFIKTIKCENPECGLTFDTKDLSLTVTPYDIEYLENCDIPEVNNGDLDHIHDLTDDPADI